MGFSFSFSLHHKILIFISSSARYPIAKGTDSSNNDWIIYSDGWFELEGIANSYRSSDKRYIDYTLPFTMKNTHYYINNNGIWSGMDNGRCWWTSSRTTTKVIFTSNMSSCARTFRISGYLAEGQYEDKIPSLAVNDINLKTFTPKHIIKYKK